MITDSDDTPPTREQLLRAREDIQQQLDVLSHPFRFGRKRQLEAKLERMLKDIDECLTAMKTDDVP